MEPRMVACCTCSLGHPGCSCQSPGPAAQQRPCHQSQARGRARTLWARLQWGSCLYILQFGSHSTDVWGRPPLPLPLLLSAWPIPARVSAVPTGEGGGLFQSSGPSQLRTTRPSLVNSIPGRLQGAWPPGSGAQACAPNHWLTARAFQASSAASLAAVPALCRQAFSQGGWPLPSPRCAPWPRCSGSQPPNLGLSHLTLSTAFPSLLTSMQRQDFKLSPPARPIPSGLQGRASLFGPSLSSRPLPGIQAVLTHCCSGPKQGGCG